MSSIRRGAAGPVTLRNGSMSGLRGRHVAHVDDMAGDGSGGRHRRTCKVGSDAAALPVLEVAVSGRHAALAGLCRIAVGAGAHGAPGVAPLEPRREENVIEPLVLGELLHG